MTTNKMYWYYYEGVRFHDMGQFQAASDQDALKRIEFAVMNNAILCMYRENLDGTLSMIYEMPAHRHCAPDYLQDMKDNTIKRVEIN